MGIPLQQETAWLSMSWPFSWFMSKQSEIPPVTENIRLQAWNQPLRLQGKGVARLRPERQGSAGWEGQQRLSGHRGDQVCDPLRKRGISRRAASLPSLLRTMGSTHLSAKCVIKGWSATWGRHGSVPGGGWRWEASCTFAEAERKRTTETTGFLDTGGGGPETQAWMSEKRLLVALSHWGMGHGPRQKMGKRGPTCLVWESRAVAVLFFLCYGRGESWVQATCLSWVNKCKSEWRPKASNGGDGCLGEVRLEDTLKLEQGWLWWEVDGTAVRGMVCEDMDPGQLGVSRPVRSGWGQMAGVFEAQGPRHWALMGMLS